MRLLASREHSRAELRSKLALKSADANRLEQVLDALEANNSLSDERYVEQYVGFRKRKGFGPLRIRMELKRKGIDNAMISDWLDERNPEWMQLLESASRSKFGFSAPADFRERGKRARFLEYRGFPTELIRRFLWSDE